MNLREQPPGTPEEPLPKTILVALREVHRNSNRSNRHRDDYRQNGPPSNAWLESPTYVTDVTIVGLIPGGQVSPETRKVI